MLKIKHKKKASIDEFLPFLVFITAAMILLAWTINTHAALQAKNDLNYIARQTMLKMESDGYLTEEDKSYLIDRLAENEFYGSEEAAKEAARSKNKTNVSTIKASYDKDNFLSANGIKTDYKVSSSDGTVGYGNTLKLCLTVYRQTDTDTDQWGKAQSGSTVSQMTVHLESTSKQ